MYGPGDLSPTVEDIGGNKVWSGPVEYCLRSVAAVERLGRWVFLCLSTKPNFPKVVLHGVRSRESKQVQEGDIVLTREAWVAGVRQVLAATLIRNVEPKEGFNVPKLSLACNPTPIDLGHPDISSLSHCPEHISVKHLRMGGIKVIDARA